MKKAVIYIRVSTPGQAKRDRDPEGYSIPAQREACTHKAESLDATVVAEYVDAGESARSADRTELQRMLSFLQQTKEIDYVIVHKVDRLARNREDDVSINLAIRKAGAKLVSCTENIDETPSGRLVHGIMATIADFYSSNLASEVVKGMTQKAKTGGTITRAPLGYMNHHELVDGQDIRWVDIDENRADLVRLAFKLYATGDYSLVTRIPLGGLSLY
ncbi:MAG TPA: recombinase family protein [Candidatus Saccharimonadia bacterium]|nr:recombinase family protein [Candidatus Saccharimonadia bacterium]